MAVWLAGPEAYGAARESVAAQKKSPLENLQGDDPIVVSSALIYMPEWWYGSARLRARIHYLGDLPYAVRQADFLPELSLTVNQPYVPSKIDSYRAFLSAHRRFLLVCGGSSGTEWMKERLLSEGWSVKAMPGNGAAGLYLAEAPGK
jgi:hypothetical protein